MVPTLSKPWKRAWEYMKDLLANDEQELEDLVVVKKPKWQIQLSARLFTGELHSCPSKSCHF